MKFDLDRKHPGSTSGLQSLLFGWNCYPPNLQFACFGKHPFETQTLETLHESTIAWNPNTSLKHLVETIKPSLSRTYSSKRISRIFSLIPAPRCLPHTPILTSSTLGAVPECSRWGPTQEAPKRSSKGADCLFFGHATAPFSCKTPALSPRQLEPKWGQNGLDLPILVLGEQHIGPGVSRRSGFPENRLSTHHYLFIPRSGQPNILHLHRLSTF